MQIRHESSMLEDRISATSNDEVPGYLDRQSHQIYCVLHRATQRTDGQVLLAGPFGPRHLQSYVPWTRWARFLASHGMDVLRLDYGGTGESTGDFGRMDLETWLADLRTCAQWMRQKQPGLPLVLHGLEIGALLALRLYREGVGNALLAWSPPPSARGVLVYLLKQKCAADYLQWHSAVMSQRQCIAHLETGHGLDVAGYHWSSALWHQSKAFTWEPPAAITVRPWRCTTLDISAGPLHLPWETMYSERYDVGNLNPNLDWLFRNELKWLREWSRVYNCTEDDQARP